MNENAIRKAVLDVLQDIAPEVDTAGLSATKLLRDQVDLDSMDWLNFLVALHERLGVEIPEADYAGLTTLDAVVAYLVAKSAG